jgi:TonB family protein
MYRFGFTTVACFLTMSSLAFAQAVASVTCSDCASIPKPLNIPKPIYPVKARHLSVSGKVSVRIVIDQNGSVVEAKADSGDEIFRESAEVAALKAKFEPAMSVGELRHPVTAYGQITYNFVLDDPPAAAKGRGQRLGIVNGLASYLPKPGYPKLPIDACASGELRVRVLIGKNGRVKHAAAISGNRFFRNSAVMAARRARFNRNLDVLPSEQPGIIAYNFPPSGGCRSGRPK